MQQDHRESLQAIARESTAHISRNLRRVVDKLQIARAGGAELDALIDKSLGAIRRVYGPCLNGSFPAHAAAGWSHNLAAALTALPENYNFSVGQRDGICWAWLQPNDDWQPGDFEARHDHPGGSGLVVAYTAALALIAAALLLYTGLLETNAKLDATPAHPRLSQ